jgi:hypothetical protein
MAEATLVNKPIYELRLSENEARLIKALTQNSMFPGEEHAIDRECRESIWNALNKAGVK